MVCKHRQAQLFLLVITNRTFLGGVRIIVIVLYTPIPYSGPILIVKGTEYQDLEFGVNG